VSGLQDVAKATVVNIQLYLLMMGLDTPEGWRNIPSRKLCIKLVFLYTNKTNLNKIKVEIFHIHQTIKVGHLNSKDNLIRNRQKSMKRRMIRTEFTSRV